MKPSISMSPWMCPTPAVSVGSAEASVGLNGTGVSIPLEEVEILQHLPQRCTAAEEGQHLFTREFST